MLEFVSLVVLLGFLCFITNITFFEFYICYAMTLFFGYLGLANETSFAEVQPHIKCR